MVCFIFVYKLLLTLKTKAKPFESTYNSFYTERYDKWIHPKNQAAALSAKISFTNLTCYKCHIDKQKQEELLKAYTMGQVSQKTPAGRRGSSWCCCLQPLPNPATTSSAGCQWKCHWGQIPPVAEGLPLRASCACGKEQDRNLRLGIPKQGADRGVAPPATRKSLLTANGA